MTKSYSHRWDAYYISETGEWTENKCSDPNCEFCSDRPEKYPVEQGPDNWKDHIDLLTVS